MRKRLFIYYACCTGIYLLLFLLELFVLDPVLDYFGESFWRHLLVYVVLLLIINPLLTKLISEKLPISRLGKEDDR